MKRYSIQFLNHPYSDDCRTPSIAVALEDGTRLFFGLPEGFIRLITQNGISMKKAEKIFIIGENGVEETGGLCGKPANLP
jgi:hypothetical protein